MAAFRPKLFSMARMENANEMESEATFTELLLITIALATSVILAITPSTRSTIHATSLPPNTGLRMLLLLAILTAIGVAIVAVVLGWRREISLDALDGVAFALIPAVFSLPAQLIIEEVFRLRMKSYKSLHLYKHQFRYLRCGRPCQDSLDGASWADTFDDRCAGEECTVELFIRYQTSDSTHWHHRYFCYLTWRKRFDNMGSFAGLLSRLWTNTTSCAKKVPVNSEGEVEQWWGIREGHSMHAVILRDQENGVKFWWWNAISSATWLIANPKIARLSRREQVLNALVLFSDIISIGDLVLYHNRDFLKHQVQHNHGITRAVDATPAIMCNLLIEELKLNEWGKIDRSILNVSEWPERKPEEYGILFFILTEKSSFYKPKASTSQKKVSYWNPAQRFSGQEILDRLESCDGSSEGTDAKTLSEQWLSDWGCDNSLREYRSTRSGNSSNETSGISHVSGPSENAGFSVRVDLT